MSDIVTGAHKAIEKDISPLESIAQSGARRIRVSVKTLSDRAFALARNSHEHLFRRSIPLSLTPRFSEVPEVQLPSQPLQQFAAALKTARAVCAYVRTLLPG
jgi:hypothetical protein